jgi:hypothetical protein
MAMDKEPFAAIVSVGRAQADMCDALELLSSLVRHEPAMAWCIICEDAPKPRGLSDVGILKSTRRAISIARPRSEGRGRWPVGLFEALSWVHANTTAAFVLKIDTDALVVGPFAQSVRTLLATTPDAGIVGTLGVSCNPNVRAIRAPWMAPWLFDTYRLLPLAPDGTDHGADRMLDVDGVGRVSVHKRRLFDTIRPHIAAATTNGYVGGQFCEPGAFVLTKLMCDRMADSGYLSSENVWSELPFPENHVLEMYAWAVGLRTCDCSDPGQPFGLQVRGLPFTPEELVARGHSVIHSVRNDVRFSEDEIRQFFRRRASSDPPSGTLDQPGLSKKASL